MFTSLLILLTMIILFIGAIRLASYVLITEEDKLPIAKKFTRKRVKVGRD